MVCDDSAAGRFAALAGVLVALLVPAAIFLWRRPDRKVKCLVQLSLRLKSLYAQLSLRPKVKQMLGFYQIATRVPDVFLVPLLVEENAACPSFLRRASHQPTWWLPRLWPLLPMRDAEAQPEQLLGSLRWPQQL